mgnify:CR=1 FL=1
MYKPEGEGKILTATAPSSASDWPSAPASSRFPALRWPDWLGTAPPRGSRGRARCSTRTGRCETVPRRTCVPGSRSPSSEALCRGQCPRLSESLVVHKLPCGPSRWPRGGTRPNSMITCGEGTDIDVIERTWQLGVEKCCIDVDDVGVAAFGGGVRGGNSDQSDVRVGCVQVFACLLPLEVATHHDPRLPTRSLRIGIPFLTHHHFMGRTPRYESVRNSSEVATW